jgi:hypothetical protein
VSYEPLLRLDFPAQYELVALDRITRSGEFPRAFGFPGGYALDRQRELSAGVIVGIRPKSRDGWIGVFELGAYAAPPAARRQVIGMPDEVAVCVVEGGVGVIVRTDDPTATTEIASFPITGVTVVRDHGIVVFADFTSLTAYDTNGLLWESERLALDDLRVLAVEADVLKVSGYDPTTTYEEHSLFTVDLRTGRSDDSPFRDG